MAMALMFVMFILFLGFSGVGVYVMVKTSSRTAQEKLDDLPPDLK
ncbi:MULTISPECIES: hypothetical protein [unclassified Halomonas]|nr:MULTISPECIES: hypothetical protein [unclassified Halomonas]UYG00182.1 hypothetical protein OCT39_01115 [Halomonas sp. GD1P12]WNL38730.1 hypothetical protein RN346_15760 [Halomonas sp. PAMB 3232]WNL42071.1 hypothetical protein RN347_15810 [Halomonas sp. PAMB 3264]